MPRERDNSKVLRAIWELQRVIDPKRVALREAVEELAEARAQSEALAEALEHAAAVLDADHKTVGLAHGVDACWLCSAESTVQDALRAYRSSRESSDAS